MQAPITDTVIDTGIVGGQCAAMLTANDIREELIRQLKAKEVTGAQVARALCIAPARVTEMKNRDRQVQQSEMRPLAELLGMVEREANSGNVYATTEIPDWGRVAQGVWLEQSEWDDQRPSVPYDQMAGDPPPVGLFAVTPEGTSMNAKWREPVRLICRRGPFGIDMFKGGDYLIVERTAHDLHEITVKRLEIDDEGVFWLHSESDDDKYQEPWRIGKPDENHHDDIEIRVLGKVIRAVMDYEGV